MTTDVLIQRLKDLRDNGECVSETLVLEQAIKSFEADRKIEKILYDIRNEITMLFIFDREAVIEIIDKHLAEVSE